MGDEIDDTPGSRLPAEWLHETGGWRLLCRRQARLFVAARLLGTVPGVLSDLVRKLGTLVEVRPTDHARQTVRAAVLLADELIRENERLPLGDPLPPAPAVAVNGGPHTEGTVRVTPVALANLDDAA